LLLLKSINLRHPSSVVAILINYSDAYRRAWLAWSLLKGVVTPLPRNPVSTAAIAPSATAACEGDLDRQKAERVLAGNEPLDVTAG
jgi:hypothetical protein